MRERRTRPTRNGHEMSLLVLRPTRTTLWFSGFHSPLDRMNSLLDRVLKVDDRLGGYAGLALFLFKW